MILRFMFGVNRLFFGCNAETIPVTSWIEAVSAAITMLATVVVAGFAWLQIKHRNEERRERQTHLDAIARYHGLILRNRLRDAVFALDALRSHTRHLASWRQQAQLAADYLHIAWTRLEEMTQAMIERQAGTSVALDELLRSMLAASDAARELAGPTAQSGPEENVTRLYQTARKQSLVALNRVETELRLEPLPPIFQPSEAPGALGNN